MKGFKQQQVAINRSGFQKYPPTLRPKMNSHPHGIFFIAFLNLHFSAPRITENFKWHLLLIVNSQRYFVPGADQRVRNSTNKAECNYPHQSFKGKKHQKVIPRMLTWRSTSTEMGEVFSQIQWLHDTCLTAWW